MKKDFDIFDVYEMDEFCIIDSSEKGMTIDLPNPTRTNSLTNDDIRAFHLPSSYKGPLFSIPSSTAMAYNTLFHSILIKLSMLHQDTPPFISTDILMDAGNYGKYPTHVVEPFIQSYYLASAIMNDNFNWEQLCIEKIEISEKNGSKNTLYEHSLDTSKINYIHRFLKLNHLHCITNKITSKLLNSYQYMYPVYCKNGNLIGYIVPIPMIEAMYLIPMKFATMLNKNFTVEFKVIYVNQFDEETEFSVTSSEFEIFEMCAGLEDAIFYHTLLNCDPKVDHTNLIITCKLDDYIIGSREYSYLEERGFRVSLYNTIEDIIKDFDGTPTKMTERER